MSSLDAFRSEVRDWLETHCPPSMRTRGREKDWVWGGRRGTFAHPDARVWLHNMANRGWTCPTWPRAYGGGGLTFDENQVLQQELRHINARIPLQSFGISMLGPILLEYGDEAQKQRHLPAIARGEIRWCQGYSEPGAGSDLASLNTTAELIGDEYVVNGSKIWTSFAHLSDWIYCLVRTDRDAPKHEGISFLLLDMQSPGVTATPIQLISGASQFCETHFDNVRVPKSQLVGGENEGWGIAKRLLQHERNMVAGTGSSGRRKDSSRSVENLAKHYLGEHNGQISDPDIRVRVIQHKMNAQAFGLTLQRAAEEARSLSAPSPASSMFKYFGTEQSKARFDLTMEILGTRGLGWEAPGFSEQELAATRQWLRSRANSIEGGTSEIQLNVIAKRVLALPD